MEEAKRKIDEYLATQGEWQKSNLTQFRELVNSVVPDVEETWKWNVPVFLVNKKLVCAMSTFKDHTKFNFFEGAVLNDEQHVFNNGLESKKHRAIDMGENDTFEKTGIESLLQQASANARNA